MLELSRYQYETRKVTSSTRVRQCKKARLGRADGRLQHAERRAHALYAVRQRSVAPARETAQARLNAASERVEAGRALMEVLRAPILVLCGSVKPRAMWRSARPTPSSTKLSL